MSKPPPKRAAGSRVRINGIPSDEYVGRGHPPRAHRFKPGESGNPSGRRKGSKNESTLLREILLQKLKIRSGGRLKTISVLEAILRRLVEDSLRGSIKSAAFILNRYAAMVSGELPPTDVSDDDREILEAFARRLGVERSDGKDMP